MAIKTAFVSFVSFIHEFYKKAANYHFTGTGAGNSWFNWVSTSTTTEGASSASGVNCGCGNLVKDECFFPGR